jgi:endopeptidase Clp ATP-binding regulatory subunit ClpX
MSAPLKPSEIVRQLDLHVIGQVEAKRTLAVAIYTHFRKMAWSESGAVDITKSNILLIGPTGTGKTLLCETLAKILDVPFVTADATSLAQTEYVSEEIEAMLHRLLDRADGDMERAQRGIIFIDEIDKLRSISGQARAASGESVQHALLKIMEGAPVRLKSGQHIDTTHILFICGGAFVGLDKILEKTHTFGFISTSDDQNEKIIDRLNSRVKPTDLREFGLIPGIRRSPAHRRPSAGSDARDAGAHHDRTAERDLPTICRNFARGWHQAQHRAHRFRADCRTGDGIQSRRPQSARHFRGNDDQRALRHPRHARPQRSHHYFAV